MKPTKIKTKLSKLDPAFPHNPARKEDLMRRILIIGSSGSGKSYCALRNALPMLPLPKKIYYFAPSPPDAETQQVFNVYLKHKTEIITSSNLDDVNNIVMGEREEINNFEESLGLPTESKTPDIEPFLCTTIIDDYADDKDLEKLNDLFTRGRHHSHIILITQSYFNCPITIRSNLTDLFLFPMSRNINPIFQDIANYFNDVKEFKRVYKDATKQDAKGRHRPFLNICLLPSCPDEFKIRKGFYSQLKKYSTKK